MAIRVLIADDDPLFLTTLRLLLDEEAGFEVVAEVTSGEEAVRLTGELLPDAVLLDVHMDGMNGLDAAEAIRASVPATLVMLHSGGPSAEVVVHSREIGIRLHDKRDLYDTISLLFARSKAAISAAGSDGDAPGSRLAPRRPLEWP